MIRKITLVNWRSHEKTELSFGKGTNIIVGIMGAGKSSVLEGICYGLFGTFPALQARKLRLADIISNRPVQKAEASVELEFDADGGEYKVVRTISRAKKSGSAELRKAQGEGAKEWKLVERDSERVNDYVEKLLRIDYDLFTRAVFSEQNRIDYFLTLRPGERKEKIDELLGIDKFEKARSNVKSVVNRIRGEVEAQKAASSSMRPEKLAESIAELEKERDSLKQRLGEADAKLKQEEADRKKKHDALKDSEGRHVAWEGLDRRKARHEQALADLRKELEQGAKQADHHKDASAELETAKAEIEKLDGELKQFERSNADASSHLGAVRAKSEELAKLQKKNEELHKSLSALTSGKNIDALESEKTGELKSLETVRTRLAEAEASISSLEEAENALAKAGATCPVCDAPLDEQKKRSLAEKRRGAITEARKLSLSLKSDMSSKSKLFSELEERIGKALRLQGGIVKLDDAELKRLHGEEARLKSLLEAGAKEADALRARRAEAEKKVRELDQKARIVRELAEKRDRLSSVEKELAEISTELAKLGFKEAELHEALSAAGKCEAEMKVTANNISNWSEQLAKCEKSFADARALLDEAEKRAKKIGDWEGKVQELEIFGNAITDVQASLRSELIDAINSAMNAVWRTVYPYGDYPKIRLSTSGEGYELELGDGKEWTLAEGAASGGERACACLALRIAFARVLVPNLSWLILDEPTHNLDAEAIRTLALALRDEIPAIVDQVFVITHDEALKEAASGRLYMLDRNKRENGSTSSELLSS